MEVCMSNKQQNQNPSSKGGSPNRGDAVLRGIGNGLDILNGGYKVAKGVVDLVKLIKQHPEWYTHYSTSNLISVNLASKQNVNYPEFNTGEPRGAGFKMPSIAKYGIQLTVPKGDEDGWKTGVRLLYQQLRTANSGKVNYESSDLEKYIVNTRLLHAIGAWLNRLYKISYTFKSTNSSVPLDMLAIQNVDFDDIMYHAADLLMYAQRFNQQIRVSFPLSCDLLRRTRWLFQNVFVDSDSHKPSFYIPTINFPANSFVGASGVEMNYYTSAHSSSGFEWTKNNSFNKPFTVGTKDTKPYMWNYDTIVQLCQEIKNALLEDRAMSIIAGDIIKAFGDRAFLEVEIVGIDSTVDCYFDEYIMNQFQNAVVINTVPDGNLNPGESSDSSNFSKPTYTYTESSDNSGWIVSELTQYTNVSGEDQGSLRDQLINEGNQRLINWHDNKIDPGELMSITRLIPTDCYMDDTNPGTRMGFNTFGTEVVVEATAIVNNTIGQKKFVSIGGTLLAIKDQSLNMFVWANFDYSPRIECYQYAASPSAIMPSILDWDVFALVDKMWFANYYSYGNQSLLYCGESQNQSRTKVYAKDTKKKGGYKSNKSGSKDDDNSNGTKKDA